MMMKAWVIDRHGAPNLFRCIELKRPTPRAGEALIQVAASSVNPIDYKIRRGDMPLLTPPFPAILQGDLSGIVCEVGPGVESISPGDEVFGLVGGIGPNQGCLADYVCCDARLITQKPKTLNFREAAALPLVSLTAFEGFWKSPITAGDSVLIQGVTGGVGHVALQLAKSAGAMTVGTGGNKDKLQLIAEYGPDALLNYREESLLERTAELTGGRGFDAVFDTVGGPVLSQSFSLVRPNGCIISIQARGNHDLTEAHARGVSLHIVFVALALISGDGRKRHHAFLSKIAQLVDAGKLRPMVDEQRFSFHDLAKAHEFVQAGKQIGKLVLHHPDFSEYARP